MNSETIEFESGALSALVNTYPVDGRVSWHDPGVRGYAPMNCYLLSEPGGRVLCDTGLTVHRDQLLAQLRQLGIAPGELTVFLLRQGEFDSMCNLDAVVREYEVARIYGQYVDAPGWAHVNSDPGPGSSAFGDAEPETIIPGPELPVPVGTGSGRELEVFVPALRLLGTYWAYDRATGTLFTSDSFTYVTRASEDGPWTVGEENDETTVEEVTDHLLGTRYWWLPGARVDEIRADLRRIRSEREVRRIAPACGCILDGAAVVERHFDLLDEAIGRVGRAGANEPQPVGGGER